MSGVAVLYLDFSEDPPTPPSSIIPQVPLCRAILLVSNNSIFLNISNQLLSLNTGLDILFHPL